MKTIIEHISGKHFESLERVVKCPFGKNRKMKDTDSVYNEVCDGCQDNWGGWQNSEFILNRCHYEKSNYKKSINMKKQQSNTEKNIADMLSTPRELCIQLVMVLGVLIMNVVIAK